MTMVALLMAAGRGERAGSDVAKQFALLGGRPVLAWGYDALATHPAVDAVVVVVADGQEATVASLFTPLPARERPGGVGERSEPPPSAAERDPSGRAPTPYPSLAGRGVEIATGGATRQASVAAGLAAARALGADRVLVHDAARPFLPAAVIDRLLAALDTHDGAVPVLAVADTLAHGDALLGDVMPRDGLVRIQTPQAFRLAALVDAHAAWTGGPASDDTQMVRRLGGRVALVQGDAVLDKITYPADFAAAEARLATLTDTRSASGFDVHRLEAGEELWLGGVLIPHDKGLSGHSDADVALHAITDALLGTIAAGDIGTHFPPSDLQWRGAASAQFLEHAAALVTQAGGTIVFVDLTLICEAPKIGPHRAAIRARIAAILRLDEGQVSIKATTTERLGFTGRGEGIAAQAIATVRVPRRL